MSRPAGKKRTVRRLIRLVVSLILLIYLGHRIDLPSVVAQLQTMKIGFIPIAAALLVLQTALSALKWRIIIESHQLSVPYRVLLRNYIVANFLSLFLPTSFGGDVYRVFSLKDFVADKAHMMSSVLFDRISGLFALVTIAVFAYYISFGGRSGTMYLIGYCGLIAGFLVFTSGGVFDILRGLQNRFVNFGVRIGEAFRLYSRSRPVLFKTMAISLLFQMNIVLIVKIYCMSVGVDLPLWTLAVYVPLIFLTEVAPISINGLGVRESAFVFFFAQAGIPEESAAAVAVILIAVRYSVFLVIGGTLFALGIGAGGATDNRVAHEAEVQAYSTSKGQGES